MSSAGPGAGRSSATTALLQANSVFRHHDGGAIVALAGVDLAVNEGEFLAVSGPSGSGKSSLLQILAGLDLPTRGTVLWKGNVVASQRHWTQLRYSSIGLVFQEFLLLPALTACENVELALTGKSAAARRGRAEELLSSVGLSRRLGHLPHSLSGGERQRVAIARSIANDPELLLCDEPTGSLDRASATEVLKLLCGFWHSRKMALLIITHDAAVAALAQRRIQLEDGRLIRDEREEHSTWAL